MATLDFPDPKHLEIEKCNVYGSCSKQLLFTAIKIGDTWTATLWATNQQQSGFRTHSEACAWAEQEYQQRISQGSSCH